MLPADQIEISVFGPGYGECILIHIGGGQWIVVDSCVNTSGQCVALEYLERLGYSFESVKLVVATHWHDDHVRGLSKMLAACQNGKFAASLAMSAKEFIAMALARRSIRASAASSGVDEISKVYTLLGGSERIAIKAKENTTIFAADGASLAHGFDCRVTALSPSDKQLDTFLADIAELVPKISETESRCVSRGANHFAVVCLVQIGPLSILLGADLEETANADTGWTVIVRSELRPKGKSLIFKIPHHGSNNGHNDDVWTEMLHPEPIAVLTPWGRGSGLPTDADVVRINRLTTRAYSTARLEKAKSKARRAPAVEKTLKESGIVIRNAEPALGHVCIRNDGSQNFDQWEVTLDHNACSLNEW